jgi:hypothetical protein
MEDKNHNAENAADLSFVNTEHEKTDAENAAGLVFVNTEHEKTDAENVAGLVFVNMENINIYAENAADLVFVNMENINKNATNVVGLVFANMENINKNATNVADLHYVKAIGVVHSQTKNTINTVYIAISTCSQINLSHETIKQKKPRLQSISRPNIVNLNGLPIRESKTDVLVADLIYFLT